MMGKTNNSRIAERKGKPLQGIFSKLGPELISLPKRSTRTKTRTTTTTATTIAAAEKAKTTWTSLATETAVVKRKRL